jgi:hypothetical protein
VLMHGVHVQGTSLPCSQVQQTIKAYVAQKKRNWLKQTSLAPLVG